jgi:hypothetical protein
MVSRLRRKIADRLGGAGAIGTAKPAPIGEGPSASAMRTTFEGYVHAAPSSQNAVDLFAGEWSSAFPEHAGVQAGPIPLGADDRIRLLNEAFGSINGWSVLELGPLEGMHTYMLEQMGASSVTAIEGSSRAYLRCLITKEILGLQHAHFELGDFSYFLDEAPRNFDLVLASGVLYHQLDPCRMLAGASRVAPRLYLWTHYFDPSMFDTRPYLVPRFKTQATSEFEGHQFTLYVHQYAESLERKDFCGGHNETSRWMALEDLDRVIAMCGYEPRIRTLDPDHPNGPAVTMILSKPD